jgi:putative protease
MDLNIDSLKIEGRMRSVYYIALVVRTFRLLIDEISNKGSVKTYKSYENELKSVMNRPSFGGSIENPKLDFNSNIYDFNNEQPNQQFVALIKGYNASTNTLEVEQRNNFSSNDALEIVTPTLVLRRVKITSMVNEENQEITVAPHAMQRLTIKLKNKIPDSVGNNCFIRKKNA